MFSPSRSAGPVLRSHPRGDEQGGGFALDIGGVPHAGRIHRIFAGAKRDLQTYLDRTSGTAEVNHGKKARVRAMLVDLEGFTAQDAAEQLGVAASTVRAALALARRRLRAALAPQLGMVEDVS